MMIGEMSKSSIPEGDIENRVLLEEVARKVERFKAEVVDVGVEAILEVKLNEAFSVAERLERDYGAVSQVPREAAKTDPDFQEYLRLGFEYRRLRKEVLPQGVTALMSAATEEGHRAQVVEIVPSRVLSRVWAPVQREDALTQNLRHEHEAYAAQKRAETTRDREVLEIMEEKGLAESDEEVVRLIRNQVDFAEEEIEKHRQKTEDILIDIAPLVEKAKIASDILVAAQVVSPEEVEKLSAPFSTEAESTSKGF